MQALRIVKADFISNLPYTDVVEARSFGIVTDAVSFQEMFVHRTFNRTSENGGLKLSRLKGHKLEGHPKRFACYRHTLVISHRTFVNRHKSEITQC